jgi:predicted  nucleic acid-binding Zn-ribbon protein
MAQKFVKKWFEPGEIDGEIVKIKEGQSLKAMEGSSEVDLIKIESGKVMLKGAEAALQSDISALESDIESALNDAKSYADGKISDLVNGAPVALDTLKELADKLGDGEDALNALITQVDENLQDAKDYTDQKISEIPAVDLSSYETIANVDSKDAAKLVEAKSYTDAQIAAIPPVDLSNYYNKSQVDSGLAAKQTSIDELDSRLDTAEPKITSLESSVSTLQTNLSTEILRAQGVEAEIDVRLDAVEPKVTAIESDISDLDSRIVPMEEILEFEKVVVYENNAAVYPDSQPGVEDASLRPGWYYQNLVAGQKIHWYFFDGVNQANIQQGQFSAYAVVTMDSIASLPIMAVYTKPTGTNDAVSGFAHSRYVYSGFQTTPVVGKKYLVHIGEAPEIHPELPRLPINLLNSQGEKLPTEEILTVSFGSDSGTAVGNVKFMVEHLGVSSPSYKGNAELKIRAASLVKLEAEKSERQAADIAKLAEAKAYTDTKIAEIPSTDLSGFYTKSEVDSKESALDSKISTEKERLDAILLASDADKNTFAEIVQLINQVDTTNDQAFAGYALANDAAVEALDGRLDIAEPKISTLEFKVSTLESEMDQAQSDLGSLDGRLDVAEPKISSLESNMSTAQSNISTLQGKVSTLESKMSTAESDISAAKSDISALETQVASIMGVVEPVISEDEEIVPSVLTHVDLENEALKIYKVCVGRVPVFKNVDYSVSVVEGKSRLTWINDMAVGGSHAVALSDKIYCTYLHSGASEGEGGGGSGGGEVISPMIWHNASAPQQIAGSNGSLEVTVNSSYSLSNETGFSGPFEVTYTFNGFFPLGNSSIGYGNYQGDSWKYGFGQYMTFNGTDNPKLGNQENQGFTISAYGFSPLSSGLNTVKFEMDAAGAVSVTINGQTISIGNFTASNTYWAGARLRNAGEKIESTSLIVG